MYKFMSMQKILEQFRTIPGEIIIIIEDMFGEFLEE